MNEWVIVGLVVGGGLLFSGMAGTVMSLTRRGRRKGDE